MKFKDIASIESKNTERRSGETLAQIVPFKLLLNFYKICTPILDVLSNRQMISVSQAWLRIMMNRLINSSKKERRLPLDRRVQAMHLNWRYILALLHRLAPSCYTTASLPTSPNASYPRNTNQLQYIPSLHHLHPNLPPINYNKQHSQVSPDHEKTPPNSPPLTLSKL